MPKQAAGSVARTSGGCGMQLHSIQSARRARDKSGIRKFGNCRCHDALTNSMAPYMRPFQQNAEYDVLLQSKSTDARAARTQALSEGRQYIPSPALGPRHFRQKAAPIGRFRRLLPRPHKGPAYLTSLASKVRSSASRGRKTYKKSTVSNWFNGHVLTDAVRSSQRSEA